MKNSIQNPVVCLALLAIITLTGAGLRLYKLDEKSLWSDEIATIATSYGNRVDPVGFELQGNRFDPEYPIPARQYIEKATKSHGAANWKQLTRTLQANIHPPLFFALINLWLHQVGLSVFNLRLPAVLFGILGIPLVYWLACKLAGIDVFCRQSVARQHGFSLLAATLFALSSYQVDHAQDARQYTLLIDIALLAIILSFYATTQSVPSKNVGGGSTLLSVKRISAWIVLPFVLAAGLYTQYFFAVFAGLVFLLLIVFQYWRNQSCPLRFWLCWLAALNGLFLLFLPWLPAFLDQMAFYKLAGHYTAGLWNPVRLPEKIWRILCEFLMPFNPLGKLLPLGFLAAAFMPERTAQNAVSQQLKYPFPEYSKKGFIIGITVLWLLAVVFGQVTLDILKDTHTATIRRYLLLASPAWSLLMAYGAVRLWNGQKNNLWQKRMAVGATLLLTGAVLTDTVYRLVQHHTSSDEYKQAAQWINEKSVASDLRERHMVLVNKSGAIAVGMAYYLSPDIPMKGLHIAQLRNQNADQQLLNEVKKIVHAQTRIPPTTISLVFSHAANSTKLKLPAYFLNEGYQTCSSKKVPGVLVIQISRNCLSFSQPSHVIPNI